MRVTIKVCVAASPQDTGALVRLANTTQDRFSFGDRLRKEVIPVRIAAKPCNALFEVSLRSGITISAWQADGICRYLNITRAVYFLVSSLLGLTQWRTLQQNPLLIEEDLMHEVPQNCLFANQSHIQNYALLLERPYICADCIEFYRCMGAEPEIEALLQTLSYLDSLQESLRLSRKEGGQLLVGAGKERRGLPTSF